MESPNVTRLSGSATPPSPFHSSSGDDVPLHELHDYLETILVDVLVPGAVIKPEKRPEVVTLLQELCCIMMGEFPPSGVLEWDMLQDRVKIIEVSLEIMHRALLQADGILGESEQLERVILVQFLIFAGTLETWISSGADKRTKEVGPRKLKERLRSVALEMLMVLAGAGSKSPGRKLRLRGEAFRTCLEECLGIATDLSSINFIRTIYLTFFGSPRLHEKAPEVSDKTTIKIDGTAVFHLFITECLYIVAHATHHAVILTAVPGLIRRTTEVVCSYLSNVLALPTSTTSQLRLARVLEAIEPLLSGDILEPLIIPPYLGRVVVKRLQDKPHNVCGETDECLIKVLDAVPLGTRLAMNISLFQQALDGRPWDHEGEGQLRDIVYACLRISVPLIGTKHLRLLEMSAKTHPSCHRRDLLLDAISQIAPLQTPQLATPVPVKRKREAASPRSASTIIIKDWFFPDNPTWMFEEEDFSDVQWCSRIIDDVTKTLQGPIDNSPTIRSQLAKRLMRIPCLVSHPGNPRCSREIITLGISFIPPFLTVANRLMECSEGEVAPDTRRDAYEILGQAVKHQSQDFGGPNSETISNLIKDGMLRRERGIRLSAGRVLADLVPVYQSFGRGSSYRIDRLIQIVAELLGGINLGIMETALITVGLVGRVVQGDTLGKILHLLIPQLGHQNPVIKGLAYIQILDLTRYHGKSPYTLLAPYLPQISTYIVTSLHTKSELMSQICGFLNMTASKFYNLTLTHFLPHLVCTCDREALNQVAREVKKSPVSLVTTHDVMAHVFLLERPGETEKVFNFILGLLRETKNDDSEDITVLMLVKSTVVPLLGEIVICMGDKDPRRAEQAISAIRKVEQVLACDRRHRASSLLVDYIMGIVSHLNEVLQDIHGKRPLEIKKKVMRSLGALVNQVGSQITIVAPQMMATMQSMLVVHALADETLFSWHIFITTLAFKDIRPYIGPTSAAFVTAWPQLTLSSRKLATQALHYLLFDNAGQIGNNLDEMVALDGIPELAAYSERLDGFRSSWSLKRHLQNLLHRVMNDNLTVAELSLTELRRFMQMRDKDILELASGDLFDSVISKIVAVLWSIACRDGEGADTLRLLAFDCLGRLGAADPDRLELTTNDSRMILFKNFEDEEESIHFAIYLITDVLLGTFRSTSDIKFQSHLAFAIQELLKFCGFTEALVTAHPSGAIPLKTRSRWSSLPPQVLEACTPLLQAKYAPTTRPTRDIVHPIYPSKSTYREWMQDWTAHLIDRATVRSAKAIFDVFRPVVIDKDVGVARHLLPHLVLHILISGNDDDVCHLQEEIVAVLEDQVHPVVGSQNDRRLLSAETVFMLMDHLNRWIRAIRQEIVVKRAENKRSRGSITSEDHLARVDSVLSSVDHNLMAKAAFECKAYARSLMNFERQILSCKERGAPPNDIELQSYYERLHEIYAHLDEPDGMEGITTNVLSPSLEHQIRQHESTGRWTSAQSCWEVRLQSSPDNIDFHLGLLRCLRNLGHYDTLRTHIKGVLSRNPDWHRTLSGFQVEGAWMVGDWESVQELAHCAADDPPSEITVARVLLAMQRGDDNAVSTTLSVARMRLGAPIHAAGSNSYRRAYDSVLNLHLVRDMELIYETIVAQRSVDVSKRYLAINTLSKTLSRRFEATLPSFRTREPVLSLQRTALGLSPYAAGELKGIIGRAWLSTAKIARKAGHAQTAYGAVLQAQRVDAPFSFIQSAKLVKSSGEPLRALQELNKALEKTNLPRNEDVVHFTEDNDSDFTKMNAKAQVLRAQWMYDAERFDLEIIHEGFKLATNLAQNWESAHFHLGNFYDRRHTRMSSAEKEIHGPNMSYQTVKCYAKTLQTGSKYVYQTMPRMLTLWLDLGENENILPKSAVNRVDNSHILARTNIKIAAAIRIIATYKWLTAFPQIVSRVDHSNKVVYEVLSSLITRVLEEYPQQGLWLFMSVVQSKKIERNRRGNHILDRITNNPLNADKSVPLLAAQCRTMTGELLKLCSYAAREDAKMLSMTKLFPGLARLGDSQLIVPLQESLIASLPSESSLEGKNHQPFPHHLPTIKKFDDNVEIMKSMAKPRKITIQADNGKTFAFLGKPKDDLRKDARLMDFNAIINKLLNTNSDSRRRQLHIRTYSVITLNEESGIIQWVPNTIPMRPVLTRSYEVRGIQVWSSAVNAAFSKIKELPVDQAADYFIRHVLPAFPPVFHEWFIDTFPEPSAWLASRLSYARTAAVMSMVGFIIGLGDRHSENILLDVNTGDIIHVDFDCLFEKGKKLETPERVPFRLTHNMQDGLGVTNVDGPFRIACEVTMNLLRRNMGCLMSVLDAFIHDPLVEWEDEKKKMDKQLMGRSKRGSANHGNILQDEVDLRKLAKNALSAIQMKLQGIHTPGDGKEDFKTKKEMTTGNLVDALIQESKSNKNLARMYPGWGPHL